MSQSPPHRRSFLRRALGLAPAGVAVPVAARASVVTAPGVDFETADGRRFLRFSFCMDASVVDEAIRRLEPWFRSLNRR